MLALKLVGKERLSQINDFNFDKGFGLFAGLNVFAAMHGEGDWFVCFVYFLLGEAGCWLGFKAYCLVTPYDDIKAIERGREAVSLVSAGFMISMGLLAMNALWGDFLGYDVMLVNFIGWFFGGLILLLLFNSQQRRMDDFLQQTLPAGYGYRMPDMRSRSPVHDGFE